MSQAVENKALINKKYENGALMSDGAPIEIRAQYDHYGVVEFQKSKDETKVFDIVLILEKNQANAAAPHLFKVNVDVEVDLPAGEK